MISLKRIPSGYAEVVEYFGQNTLNGELNPQWQADNIKVFTFLYPMRFWDGTVGFRFQAHRLVGDSIVDALAEFFETAAPFDGVAGANPRAYVPDHGWDHFDGCYNYRSNRNAPRLSVHAWGGAVDLNAYLNPNGQEENKQPKRLIEVFTSRGWVWPNPKDNMHVQACVNF